MFRVYATMRVYIVKRPPMLTIHNKIKDNISNIKNVVSLRDESLFWELGIIQGFPLAIYIKDKIFKIKNEVSLRDSYFLGNWKFFEHIK